MKGLFRTGGSYLGAWIGLIASLQIKITRMLLYGELTQDSCNGFLGVDCRLLVLTNVFLFVLVGFLVGGLIHQKYLKS
jgi:hypothetical protein